MIYQYSDYSDVVHTVFASMREGISINGKVINKDIANNIARLYKLGLYIYNTTNYNQQPLELLVRLPHESTPMCPITCSCGCESTYEMNYDGEKYDYSPMNLNNCTGIGEK